MATLEVKARQHYFGFQETQFMNPNLGKLESCDLALSSELEKRAYFWLH